MVAIFEPGQVFERPHPFTIVRENIGDPEFETERWRPGAWDVTDEDPEYASPLANGVGLVKYTVISVHKPPGYPTRVFFTRQFFLPDGSSYRGSRLKNCISSKFAKDIKGLPFHYEVEEL